jgi:hypothetical protein
MAAAVDMEMEKMGNRLDFRVEFSVPSDTG